MFQGVGLEQVTRLTLTPEVRQGIEVMAMSAVELSEYLENRADDNPFLIRAEEAPSRSYEAPFDPDGGEGWDEPRRQRPSLEAEAADEHPWAEGPSASGEWAALAEGAPFRGGLADGAEGRLAREECLEVRLYRQLALELRDPQDLAIARQLVASLDEAGYLDAPLAAIAEAAAAEVGRVRQVLRIMQVSCEPAGLGARSLQERLVAQLASQGHRDALAYRLVRSHLEDLAAGRLSHAAAALSASLAQVKEAYELIRSLDPHPAVGLGFTTHYVRPEVAIVEGREGYEVRPSGRTLPRVLLNRDYVAAMEGQRQAPGASQELLRLLREAQGLMTAVEHRQAAVLAMAAVIAERQAGFFRHGVAELRPLTMAEMAAACGVSESTVSRVANGLFMATPQGLLEMRFFFHSSVGGPASQGASSKAVKHRIRQLVAAEDPRRPLSDGQLVEALADEGIVVSRRTVNKYRTTLGILSQSKRRTYG